MKLHPRLSRAAVELVKRFETFQPRAVAAPGGGWTLGYGHTLTAREGVEVTPADAEALLLYDLSAAAGQVEAAAFAPVTAPQFEALTAFAFSVGPDSFRRSSALARLNAGAYLDAADEIERWRVAELGAGAQVVDALVRRRAAEKAHFLSLPAGEAATASPLLRALSLAVDSPAVFDAAPPEEPSATRAALDSVQARLRDLIPDAPVMDAPILKADAHAAPVEAQPVSDPPAETIPPAEVEDASPPELPPPPAVARPRPSPEPPPPPFANDPEPLAVAPDPLAEADLAPAAGPSDASARGGRWPLLFVLIGLALFVLAVAAIALGKAPGAALAAGVIGAVLLAGGLYARLGRRRG